MPKLRIGLQAIGSRGDVSPFLSLGAGLVNAGHNVTLAVASSECSDYRDVASRLGINLQSVGCIWETQNDLDQLTKRISAEWNPLVQMEHLLRDMLCQERLHLLDVASTLCATNDLVIGHFLLHPLHLAARESGTPWLTLTHNHGLIPTRSAAILGGVNLGPVFNRIGWGIGMTLMNHYLLKVMNPLYRELGSPPLRSFREAWESGLGNLIGVSPTFCEKRPDWGGNQKVCGFFQAPRSNVYPGISAEVETFIDEGPKPVFVTLGSMLGVLKDSERITGIVRFLVESLQLAGYRAIVQAPWEKVGDIPEDPNIFRVGVIDYEKVFPRCSAVVHHGGAGTAHVATRCGVPSVVIWTLMDQLFWGSELHRLGLARRPINWLKITPEKLAASLRATVESGEIADRAKIIGRRMSAEPDGVGKAVQLIESL